MHSVFRSVQVNNRKGDNIMKGKIIDTSRTVCIKRYLCTALKLKPHQAYRLLGPGYDAVSLAKYLKDNGYVPPADKRTSAIRHAKRLDEEWGPLSELTNPT